MIDFDELDAYLSSNESSPDSMLLSDLDGFLTGIICSPELIPPSEWLPVVWGDQPPKSRNMETHVWATETVLARYNEILAMLKEEPPRLEPLFWKSEEGVVVAMDWCEGFMQAVDLRHRQWDKLLDTKQGRDWMFPVAAHLFDENGNSLVGAEQTELDALLEAAVEEIPETVLQIYRYWRSSLQRRNESC